MITRDPHEEGRTASVLELFFDLVFVIAVGRVGAELHHALLHESLGHALLSYGLMFFGIWWAWMNFTWFATSFDTDDWLYRTLTFVQMLGVLVFAGGLSRFSDGDFSIIVAGYVIMRIPLITQWLRASRANEGPLRRTTLTYAVGITCVQAGWVALIFMPRTTWMWIIFATLICLEIAVPILAERNQRTSWHPHHITERYGLFTIILLGEGLLASANAIFDALDGSEEIPQLIGLALIAFIISAMLFWIYFIPNHHEAISDNFWRSVRYGYSHYFIFAAAGALAAGMEVQLDVLHHQAHISHTLSNLTVTGPTATFIIFTWWVAMGSLRTRATTGTLLGAAALIALSTITPFALPATAIILIGAVAILVTATPRSSTTHH